MLHKKSIPGLAQRRRARNLLGMAWPQPAYGESALVFPCSGHQFVFRGTSQRRNELNFTQATVPHNLHDSLGLAGNSLTHRKS